jgi:hypothetical protein
MLPISEKVFGTEHVNSCYWNAEYITTELKNSRQQLCCVSRYNFKIQ